MARSAAERAVAGVWGADPSGSRGRDPSGEWGRIHPENCEEFEEFWASERLSEQ